jgi:hypothetical protein
LLQPVGNGDGWQRIAPRVPARAAAEAIKALQIDPYSAEAHAALGYVWHYTWRWADAEKESDARSS